MLITIALTALTAPTAAAQGAEGIFTDYVAPHDSSHRRYEAAIDVDGDGLRDLVGWWYLNPGGIRVHARRLSGHGVSGFRTIQYFIGEFGPLGRYFRHGTAAGDIDGDGRGDLVIAIGGEVMSFPSRQDTHGLWTPSHVQSFALPAQHEQVGRELMAHDFNGDGRDEVILALPYEVRLYTVDATGTLRIADVFPVTAGTTGDMNPSLELGDFDSDPEPEIGLYLPELNRITVIDVENDRLLLGELIRTELGGAGTQLAAGDIDGDGDDDLVVFAEELGQAPPKYEIVRHGSGSALTLEAPRIGGPAAQLVDVDDDGDLDGVCCGGGSSGTGPSNTDPSTFRICLNDGTGTFDTAIAIPGLGAHRLAAAMDVDGDGDIDLIGGRGMILGDRQVGAPFCAQAPNSTGAPGQLSITGSAIDPVPLALEMQDLPSHGFYLLVTGYPIGISAPHVVPGGLLCLHAHVIYRSHFGQATGAGTGTIDLTAGLDASFPSNTPGSSVRRGETFGMQIWHRDLPAFGSAGLTNGISVLVGP